MKAIHFWSSRHILSGTLESWKWWSLGFEGWEGRRTISPRAEKMLVTLPSLSGSANTSDQGQETHRWSFVAFKAIKQHARVRHEALFGCLGSHEGGCLRFLSRLLSSTMALLISMGPVSVWGISLLFPMQHWWRAWIAMHLARPSRHPHRCFTTARFKKGNRSCP